MLKYLSFITIGFLLATPIYADGKYGLGRTALPSEIQAWDIDVLPDGRGLPAGKGDAIVGEEIFANKCASCHGDFAEGVGNWPALAGGFDTLADEDPVKTVGSYWPYLSTLWDYINRSMPFGGAQTLSSDEVYSIVAYILYSNDLIEDDFVLNDQNFSEFNMYNSKGFIVDDRKNSEYLNWSKEPCMENCKPSSKIVMRASVIDVTPEESATIQETEQPVSTLEKVDVVSVDPELIKAGKKVFKKCKACHAVGEGAKNKSGPQLYNIIGRKMGSADRYKYSKGFKLALDEGRIWNEELMIEFLRKPKKFIKGTKMSFGGLKKDKDLNAIVAYLKMQDK